MRRSCSERGRCTLSQARDSLRISPDNQKKCYMDRKGSTDGDVSYLRVERFAITKGVSQDGERRVLTNTVLPFVNTIFSLLALSLVYAPLTVVGLAGYRATLAKDIVCAEKVTIDYQLQKVTQVHNINNSNYHRRQSHRRQSSPSTFSRGLSG